MLDDAEIGAFIDSECRGAISNNRGYYFMTVMGSSEDDNQKKLELRVFVDGDEYVVDNSLPFISDAAYGTLDEPYVLDLLDSQKVKRGDANGDGTVDMDDVEVTRDYIMNKRPKTFNSYAADVNDDKVVNIADVVGITNIINSETSATR